MAETLLMFVIGGFFAATIFFLILYAIKQPYSLANIKKAEMEALAEQAANNNNTNN